ncbi:MAG: 4-hydroxybenzoate octaprenyltransferase [Gammaproteobacteria bacterium]
MSVLSLSRLSLYAELMRLHRPIGIYLLAWPMLWALWIAAGGVPSPLILAVFLLGVVLMRSAGCVINDYADRHWDKHVRRTAERPLTSGKVSPREALVLFVLLSLSAFALVLLLNPLVIQLSIVGVLLAVLYPFTKRWTHAPQLVLGIAFAWAIPMAFAAVEAQVPAAAWWLFGATISWAVVYDTMYAMADREDDLKVGIRSTAIWFSSWDRFWIGVFQLLTLLQLALAGDAFGLSAVFFIGLFVAALLALYHQWLIRTREPQACFTAFLHNHWLGAIVFIAIWIDLFLV